MKIGARIPCYRAWVNSGAVVRRLASRAEALGFDSLWVHDHLVASANQTPDVIPLAGSGQPAPRPLTPEEYYAGENWWLDPYALWGFLAAATDRVELGSDIIVVPYRNPVVQAKMLGTLDVLSGGRMILGVGAGHVASESRALGIDETDYAARGKITDEYLEVMRELLTKDPASYQGDHYQMEPVRPLIRPVRRPHPPFYIGGNGRPALRRAVRLGQAWLPSNITVEELTEGAAFLRAYSDEIGRDEPPALAIALGLKVREGPSEGKRRSYSVDEACSLLDAYRRAGVIHVSLDFPNRDEATLLEQLDLFARAVRPALAALQAC